MNDEGRPQERCGTCKFFWFATERDESGKLRAYVSRCRRYPRQWVMDHTQMKVVPPPKLSTPDAPGPIPFQDHNATGHMAPTDRMDWCGEHRFDGDVAERVEGLEEELQLVAKEAKAKLQ